MEGLDRILGGGFPENEVYLVQGEPGTGKTILGLQFLLEGRERGEQGLFFTFTQRRSDLEAAAASHGWSLDGIEVHQISAARGEYGADRSRQVIFESAEIELAEVFAEVLEVVERTRPARVVFDAIAELRFLARDAARFQRQLFALRDLFFERGSTVLLLDRPASRGNDELEHISHGVILLEHEPTELGTERRRLRVLKMRGIGYHEGYHDFRIREGGLVVYPRLRPGEPRPHGWETIESGVDGLDALVGGGLAEGTSCLFVGPSGTGKTSLATLYACAAVDRGEKVAMFLFEERPETFVRRSESLGMPVRRHLDSGMLVLRPVSTGESSAGEFADSIRKQVAEEDTRVVVIDSLTGYMSAMPSEQLLLTQMHDLLSYLSGQGVLTILVVAQHGILGPALGGPVDVSYLADMVLLLRHFETDGSIRQAISVFKKRYGEHEKQIRELSMDESGIRVGAPLSGFQGLLTGTPSFSGDGDLLLRTTK